MIHFDENFHETHATLSADPRLFASLFGIGPKEFCSLSPDTYNYNDELCWLKLERPGLSGWVATIPSAEQIAAHPERPFNDCQPKYPWRHIDERPIEVEPYPLCLKLLQRAGTAALVTPEVLPYCGGLDRYGGFLRPTNIRRLPIDGKGNYLEILRSIIDKKTKVRLAKGYGLTEDGFWCPSEWLVQPDGTVLATRPRVQYYGVLLNRLAGVRFLRRYLAAESEGLELPLW